jgi:hypothetical protein
MLIPCFTAALLEAFLVGLYTENELPHVSISMRSNSLKKGRGQHLPLVSKATQHFNLVCRAAAPLMPCC